MNETQRPECFGELETVFPKENGDRNSPLKCLGCVFKTECLKEAMDGGGGVEFQKERLQKAHEAGMIGFFERWSKKKHLNNKAKRK